MSSMRGADLYAFHCASCHGRDGRGGGPVAAALRVELPDLTTVAKRNRGTFPTKWVTDLVTGEQSPRSAAHGSPEMPVWGPIFRALDRHDTRAAMKISNIVAYIETIQTK